MKIRLCIISLSFLLSACTMPQVIESVKANNWQDLGTFDGENGFIKRTPKQLKALSTQYADADADADSKAYSLSYEEALKEYCQPRNAYILGVVGKPYHGVCQKFQHGWSFYQDWVSGRHSQAGSL